MVLSIVKYRYLVLKIVKKYSIFALENWKVVRVVEGARLESVYRSKAYRGFESLTFRHI